MVLTLNALFTQTPEYLRAVAHGFVFLLSETWPLLAFLALTPIATGLFRYLHQLRYRQSKNYVVLELLIPREILKSPRGMEQVLRALHSLRVSSSELYDKYITGLTTDPKISLEVVSFGGEIHFFVRVSDRQVGLVESAFFSYYPDVELIQVEDYTKRFPQNYAGIREAGLEMFGTEYLLSKEAAYPIKTYLDFEAPEEGLQFDPISSLLEVFGKIAKGYTLALQFVIVPAGKWTEEFADVVKELREDKTKKEGALGGILLKSPGQLNTLKAVEENLTRPAFDTVIRSFLIGPNTDSFRGLGFTFVFGGILGVLNQYAMLNLNSFKPSGKVTPNLRPHKAPFFRKSRVNLRAERLIHSYFVREIPEPTVTGKILTSHPLQWNIYSESFPLTSTSLATLFHPPMNLVLTAPYIKRVESRRAGPPAGLPIFGEENVLDKFR